MTQILFFADCMLGTLAKQLRLCGYDTIYFSAKGGSIYGGKETKHLNLEKICSQESRILITRNNKYKNSQLVKVCFIKSNYLKEQLKQIFEEFNLNYNNLFSRCLICNVLIKKIEKNKVQSLAPEYVLKIHDKFSYCPECKRIYWRGSHYFRMKEKFFRLMVNGQ